MAGPARTFPREGLAEVKEASERLCQAVQGEYERAEAAFVEAESEQARVASLQQLEWDKLAAERSEVEAEKAAMEGVQKFVSSRVVLNVGGKRIETSRQTLCNAQDSMLAAMFSGRHALTPDEDGSFFIDRDGKHFRHIVNYLRNGTIQVELGTGAARELAIEAEYYGLRDLADVLGADKLHIEKYLGEEIANMRAEELRLREPLSVPKTPGAAYSPTIPHGGLISVFDAEGAVEQMNDNASADPMGFTQLLGGLSGEPRSGKCVVDSLTEFRSSLEEPYKTRSGTNVVQILEPLLRDAPILIAGGAVLRALTASGSSSRRGHLRGKCGDIDIFVCTQDAIEATAVAKRILFAFKDAREHVRVMRGPGVINVEVGLGSLFDQDPITIQIVLRLYESPAEVLLGFDVDCCCVGYDGERVWALPRAVCAIQYGANILNPLHAWPNKASYEFRLVKYALRGYAIGVPGLEHVDIDLGKILGAPLSKLKGFARLVRLVMAFQDSFSAGDEFLHPAYYEKDRETWTTFKQICYGSVFGQELATTLKEALGELEFARLTVAGWTYQSGETDMHMHQDEWNRMIARLPRAWCEGNGGVVGVGCEESAWEAIAACEPTAPSLPSKIEDAWDSSKRSREYLNAKEADLDARYFAHAARERTASAKTWK